MDTVGLDTDKLRKYVRCQKKKKNEFRIMALELDNALLYDIMKKHLTNFDDFFDQIRKHAGKSLLIHELLGDEMEIEFIGKLLPDGHLSLPSSVREKLKVGDKVRVRLTKHQEKHWGALSPQAQQLIRMFEEAPDRGVYRRQEVTREFIHD